MVQGIPYVHWKIKDAVDLTEIDPVYLWGTVIESDKGPINTPVFCTNADQVEKIFNYDLRPFFVNGGRSVVIMRAIAGQPKKASFELTLDEAFSYVYADYDYYNEDSVKAKINIVTETLDTERPKPHATKFKLGQGNIPDDATTVSVAFFEGRWRISDDEGNIKHYYKDNNDVVKEAVENQDATTGEILYYPEGTTDFTATEPITTFMKSFNESDVTKIIIGKIAEVPAGAPLVKLETIYPGDFQIPISIKRDIRSGYRISIKESDDYTIMMSGVNRISDIVKRINERANNIEATITNEGNAVEAPFITTLVPVKDASDNYILPPVDPNQIARYTTYIQEKGIPVGAIFAKRPSIDTGDEKETYEFKLVETVTYLADGSNGVWNKNLKRIMDPAILRNRQIIAAAHKEALDRLANVKLAGIFCNYGEDEVQKVYADHVSTTEPQGMNSLEVCKWRTLILGANAYDRANDPGDTSGFKLIDKAVSLDNENILFLGQGLIDDGYEPEANVQVLYEDGVRVPDSMGNNQYVSLLNEDEGAQPYQLLPFQCTQYIAGLRSKLFYGDAIFGGEAKKEIRGVGNLSIAPLFAGENKVLWQPDNYVELNQHGVLTFTTDYNILSLTDGVTTRQTPLEEDEEGVQSIIKYAKHIVHEDLQRFIGRNLTGDLEQIMENSVKGLLGNMQTQDQTLMAVPTENLAAYDVDIVLVPKSNAQQLLAKAYVYLKLTPVHALRQIEVELTVQ